MKRSYKLENLDCANCAAKMEEAINKLEGVKCSITFMTQKITLEADDDKFEAALKDAQAVIAKVEPDTFIAVK